MHTLRKPTCADEYFLFMVMQLAMFPTKQKMDSKYKLDLEKEYEKYNSPWQLNELDIIQFNGIDVGRLRVVKTNEQIYIGGFQLLPDFQNMGIGTSVLRELIEEAERLKVPVLLEVQKANLKAKAFYERNGFTVIDQNKDNFKMKFS